MTTYGDKTGIPVGLVPVPVPVDLAGTRPVPNVFSCWIIDFLCFALMNYLHHVLPSSSLAGSRAPLQFPDCITCYPSVPRLHQVLPSSSLAASRAHFQFPYCITFYPLVPKMYHAPHTPFSDTWRGKLSLFSPFVTFINFILSTDISA